MSILEDLAHAGQLALYWDFGSGTALDWGNLGNHGTFSNAIKNYPYFYAAPSGSVNTASVSLPADNYSVVLLLGAKLYPKATEYFFITNGAVKYVRISAAGVITAYNGMTRTSASVLGATCVAWNHTAGATGAIYTNGNYLGAFSGALDAIPLNTDTKYFFNNSGGAFPFTTPIKAMVITSTVLSATQHSQLVGALSSRAWPTRQYAIRSVDSSVNPNEPGLVWAPDLQHPDNQGTIQDLSPTGAAGTKVGVTEPSFSIDGIGAGRTFNGANGYTATGTSFTKVNDFTAVVVFRSSILSGLFRPLISSRLRWNIATYASTIRHNINGAYTNLGTIIPASDCTLHTVFSYRSDHFVDVYVNGNLFNTVAYVDLPAGSGNLEVGETNGAYFNGKIYRAEIYSKAFSAAEVAQLFHKSGLRDIQEQSCFGVPVSTAARGGVAGSYLESTRWAFGTTTPRYKIDVSVISGKAVKTISCTTAGPLKKATDSHWTPQQAAYGTFEFSFYKGADANAPDIYLTSSTGGVIGDGVVNGYCFRVSNLEVITLVRVTAGNSAYTIITVAPAVSNTTWYRAKVTRDFAGNWKMYLLGGTTYLGWTLVGSSAAPDNTHTTSYYQTLDLDALDLVSIGTQDSENVFSWSPFM